MFVRGDSSSQGARAASTTAGTALSLLHTQLVLDRRHLRGKHGVDRQCPVVDGVPASRRRPAAAAAIDFSKAEVTAGRSCSGATTGGFGRTGPGSKGRPLILERLVIILLLDIQHVDVQGVELGRLKVGLVAPQSVVVQIFFVQLFVVETDVVVVGHGAAPHPDGI